MIETRFKKTEVGEIPEEWEVKKLGEIGEPKMCKRIMKSQTTELGDIPFYKIGTFGNTPDAFISKELFEDYKSKFSFPRKGEILISAAGTIGRVIIYNGEDSYYQDSNIIWINNDEKVILNKFLFNLYQVVEWDTNTGTIPRLYNDNLKRTLIQLPPISEQQRIATALSDIDVLLSALNKKIEKKKLIKQGAMQLLLSGKKRLAGFTEPWEGKRLGETFKLISNNTFSRDQLSNVGIVSNIHYGDVLIKFHNIIDLRKIVLPKIKIEHRLTVRNALSNGDIVMADTAEDNTVGKVCEVYGMTSELVEAGLHTIVLRPLIQFAPIFLGYYLNSTCYHDKLMPHIQGIKVSSISKAALLSTNIFVPTDLSEQTAIATILSDMDKEIEALEAKLTKYERVKQGMMQQLLTGKIRLID